MTRSVAFVVSSLCLVAGVNSAWGQGTLGDCPPPPTAVYQNIGVVTNAQVDASAFVNWGDFLVSTIEIPWEAQGVQTWENRGIMAGTLGFRFNHTTCEGERLPAQRFENSRNATIQAFDGGGFSFFGENGGFLLFEDDASYVLVDAEEIVNRGNLSVEASGLIQLKGDTVDLSGGTVIVEPLSTSGQFGGFFGGFDLTSTNFFPDGGIYDLAWAIATTTNFNFNGMVQGTAPLAIGTPPFRITNEAFWCNEFLDLQNASSWVLITTNSPTNISVQVVAVELADSNIFPRVVWSPITYPNFDPPQAGFLTAVLEFTSPATNIITLQQFTNRLYLIDQLASHTNDTLSVNLAAGTLRPSSYILSRFAPFFLGQESESNAVIWPGIFDDQAYSNRVATNIYAAYAARVDYLTSRLPQLPDVGYTNSPGRVEIKAHDLTLTSTRIRGEGLVSIEATNFVDSTSTIIDVPNLDYDLGTTGELLRMQNLARDQVQRFSGDLIAYSSVWTNVMADPMSTNGGAIEIRFHLLMVDGSDLRTLEPVITHDLALSAPGDGQVVIEDNLTVIDRFVVDAENLTLNGLLTLRQGLTWSPEQMVRLKNLTNNGFLQLSELAEFEGLNSTPLQNFVNRGTINSFAHVVRADYFENSGQMVSTQVVRSVFTDSCLGTIFEFTNSFASIGTISVDASAARLDGGEFSTMGDIRLMGEVYKLNQYSASAGGTLFLEVTETLADNGADSGNIFQVLDGFHMTEQAQGDLLGTEIETLAARFGIVDHSWASEDRGATAAGYDNNVALGHLVIFGDLFSQFRFMPGQPGSALYVDLLEIEGEQALSLRNLTNTVRLLGLNLYFGDVRSSNPGFTAETLNGLVLGEGRLIWVQDYAGPRSGVDVALSPTGPSERMNRALRESSIIDSDGDGIPNRNDDFPLTEGLDFHFTEVTVPEGTSAVQLSFGSKPNSRYVIEYTTDLTSPEWKPLGETMESGVAGGLLSITDEVSEGEPQRYYRVRLVE